MQVTVQNFIRSKRILRERVTARQVLEHFIEENIIEVEREDKKKGGQYVKKSYDTAYCNVRRYLRKNGYKRGYKRGGLRMKESIIVKVLHFLCKFMENENLLAEK